MTYFGKQKYHRADSQIVLTLVQQMGAELTDIYFSAIEWLLMGEIDEGDKWGIYHLNNLKMEQ